MRNKVLAPLVVVIGLVLLFGSATSLNNDKVTCGGKTMHSGQVCREVQRHSGHGKSRTLSQQRETNHSSAVVMLVLGAAMVIGGVVWTIGTYRRRPAALPYYPPPNGPPPYYPPPSG